MSEINKEGKYNPTTFVDLLKTNKDDIINLVKKLIPNLPNSFDFSLFKNDKEIYEKIKELAIKTESQENIQIYRSKARVKELRQIFQVLNYNPFKKSLLDLGCGTGEITRNIGIFLKLKQPVYGTDIPEWHDIKRESQNTKEFKLEFLKDGLIPFNQKFDLLLNLMILHHILDFQKTIRDDKAHLKSESLLIVREHDALDDNIKRLIDIEHALHSIIFDGQTYDDFVNEYYGNYRSLIEWQKIFKDEGFECIYKSDIKGITRYGYLVFKLY